MQPKVTNLNALIARIKREAKKIRRTQGLSHSAALEQLARASGYKDFHDLTTQAGNQHEVASSGAAQPPSRGDHVGGLDVMPVLPDDRWRMPNMEIPKTVIQRNGDQITVTLPDGTIEYAKSAKHAEAIANRRWLGTPGQMMMLTPTGRPVPRYHMIEWVGVDDPAQLK